MDRKWIHWVAVVRCDMCPNSSVSFLIVKLLCPQRQCDYRVLRITLRFLLVIGATREKKFMDLPCWVLHHEKKIDPFFN